MNGQCNMRPTVTFLAVGNHCPLTGTNFHCLVTEARVCVCVCVNNLSKSLRDSVMAWSQYTRD